MLEQIEAFIRKLKPRFRLGHLPALWQAQARRDVMAEPRFQNPKRLIPFGQKVFSQGDEDGIIAEIFKRIGTTTKRFCEIGVGHGDENNTLALIYSGWSGVWIEGSPKRCETIQKNLPWVFDREQLSLLNAYVSAENINALVTNIADFETLDLFSIDIDGVDWHVIKALENLKARVVVVEYNAKFAPPIEFVVENVPDFRWQKDDYFSASLTAWEKLMAEKGYSLVGCSISGANAFFVRSDLVTQDKFCAPFTAENHYEPIRHHLIPNWDTGHKASLRAPQK